MNIFNPQVRLIRLVGMMLVVFVKKEHKTHISEIAAETVGTGLMNKMVSQLEYSGSIFENIMRLLMPGFSSCTL